MKFIFYLKNNNYSHNTIKTYTSILKIYQGVFHDMKSIKKILFENYTNANTIRTHYNVLLTYMKFIGDSRISNFKKVQLPKIPMKYLEVFTKDFLYRKTANIDDYRCVVIRFLFETGIRSSELKTIHKITHSTLFVLGKGNKEREVFHKNKTTILLKKTSPTTKTIRIWVKEILGDMYSPHSIRRSHATHMLLKGANPKTVMMQLGHSKVETTYRYLQLSKTTNKKIYDKLF